MIDAFQILVPSQVRVGEDFLITVRALDDQGAILFSDSTTEITMTSVDLDLLFDGNSDGTYSLVDNVQTLTQGQAAFRVRDNKAPNVTISADNSPQGAVTLVGDLTLAYDFNAVLITYLTSQPLVQTLPNLLRFQGKFRQLEPRSAPQIKVSNLEGSLLHLQDPLPVTQL
jgi:hypothetical protein